MRAFDNTCTFDYAWADVSIANWQKYCAWNTQSTHVVAVDTLDRSVDPRTGIAGQRVVGERLKGQLTIPVRGSTLRSRVSTATTCVLWVFQAQYFCQFAMETSAQA